MEPFIAELLPTISQETTTDSTSRIKKIIIFSNQGDDTFDFNASQESHPDDIDLFPAGEARAEAGDPEIALSRSQGGDSFEGSTSDATSEEADFFATAAFDGLF